MAAAPSTSRTVALLQSQGMDALLRSEWASVAAAPSTSCALVKAGGVLAAGARKLAPWWGWLLERLLVPWWERVWDSP